MRALLLLFRVAARLRRAEPSGLDALTEPNAYGIETGAWGGDEAEVELAHHQVILPLLNHSTTPADKGRDVVVLGQFNTGTNLLYKLFLQNFHYAPQHAVEDITVWKHLRPAELANLGIAKDVVLLVVLRDPLSWLQSMRKAPYDVHECVEGANPGGNRERDGFWIEQPCTLESKKFGGYTMPRVDLRGLADYWNLWTEEYDELPRYGFDRVVLIRYEDLVLQTEDVLAEVGQAVGREPPATVVHVHGPAKPHGRANGRTEAMMKLKSKAYLRTYSQAEILAACEALDRALMNEHGYGDCDEY
jgi:hypothetical protein